MSTHLTILLSVNNNDKKLDQVFASLANKRSRQIVYALGFQPASFGQLAEQQSSFPAIHRHVKVLERAKLVRRKKSGRVNFLALDRTGLSLIQNWAQSSFPDPWEPGKSIDVNLSSDDRSSAVRLLNEDAENARKAKEFGKNGQIEEVFERWSVIFRKEFPAYGY